MKQLIQNLKTGATTLEEIPVPQVQPGHVLIKTTRSLVSLGTEKMLVEFGKAGLISKARQQPDKVAMVLDKIKSDGIIPTLETVFKKLEEPLPLGYCNVGRVVAVGKGITQFKTGDRVASNGQHAEFVLVPENLVAPIPDSVTDDQAAFTVIGSIGLQGIRLLNPTIGETVVVYGLGLIGLLTAQLLKANGCNVIGIDIDTNKLKLAQSFGIQTVNPATGSEPVKYVLEQTGQIGADGVIITASAKSNEIVSNSAQMSRKRGKIVLVGVVGLELNRAEFYEKELSFQVSCSYGPGRYDDTYETKGIDYPIPFVRWTENRNFQTVLAAISGNRIIVDALITQRVAFEDFEKIYSNMNNGNSIASILCYSDSDEATKASKIKTHTINPGNGQIGIIGAGNFTKMTMLPILHKQNAKLKYIVSSRGLSGTHLAKKYGIAFSSSNYHEVLEDADVQLVIITTRHDTHAPMVVETLNAGKDVFVEKPLALTRTELNNVVQAYQKAGKNLTLGFNRRFSPFIQKMKALLGEDDTPINVIATMNAGHIPSNVWVHDLEVGGGRIIGEACHFIDLISYLANSRISSVMMSAMGTNPETNTDNASIILKYENGSQGVINYFSNGNKAYSKERVEVYTQGRNLIMDNFRSLRGYGFSNFTKMQSRQDKGHAAQFKLLIESLQSGGKALIPFDEILNTTEATLAAIESLQTNSWVTLE